MTLGPSTSRRWEGKADLVLVDANHEYEFAKVDTASALRLVRPGGWVLWDDYTSGWPGVVRAVDETGLAVVQVAGTGIAAWLPTRVGAVDESKAGTGSSSTSILR